MPPTKPIGILSTGGDRAPVLANPLLLPSVAAAPFSPALLLPAAPPQPHRTDPSAPNRPSSHDNREPNAIPLSLESSDSSSTAPKVEDKLNRVSNVKLDDDDFDIESYYARLHAIPSLDASAETEMKSVAEESSFSEIDLNSPAAAEPDLTDDGSSQNQGIASDLAQNLSQLPQVLPQVASHVFSSFSSMLNLGRSARPDQYMEPSEVVDACPIYPTDDQSDNIVIPLFNRDEFSASSKNTPASFHNDELKSANNDMQNFQNGGFNAPDSRHISQTVADKPPCSGPSNMFRMSSQKKKTYAQVPGLTLGDCDSMNKGVNVFPSNMTPSNSGPAYSIPYSYKANDNPLYSINSQSISNDLTMPDNNLHMKNQKNEDFRIVQDTFPQSQSSEFLFNANVMTHNPHIIDSSAASFQINTSNETYNNAVPIDNAVNVNNEMPLFILDPNAIENFTSENKLELNSAADYSELCDPENSNVKKIAGKTNFKAKNSKRLYSTSPSSKLNNMCKDKLDRMNSNEINDMSNFTLSNSLNQQAKFSQLQPPYSNTNSETQINDFTAKPESITDIQFPLIDQSQTNLNLQSQSFGPQKVVDATVPPLNLQSQNFGPQKMVDATVPPLNLQVVDSSVPPLNSQVVDSTNVETYDEPKFFNVSDFKNDQNIIPTLNFSTPQNNTLTSQPESAIGNNKFRMSIANKRPKYYSGPIMSNFDNPPPVPISAPAVSSVDNANVNDNQKSSQPFGLNLSKLQNAVTSFFNPYQSTEYQNAIDNNGGVSEIENKNDTFNSDHNNSTSSFFSPSQLSSNTSPYSQMENVNPMNYSTPTFFSPTQISSNTSTYSQFNDNTMSSFSTQNHDSSQNSNYVFDPSQSFSYVPPSTILNPNQGEAVDTQAHTFDFAENLVPNLEQENTEKLPSEVNFENNLNNVPFGSNPFLDSTHPDFENPDAHITSSQQNLSDTLFKTEINDSIFQKEPVKSEDSSDTKVEKTNDFDHMFVKPENIPHSSNDDKSLYHTLENMTIKFDNINIDTKKTSAVCLDDFVIEPTNEVEKTELDELSQKDANIFENNVPQQESSKNLFDSFSGSEFSINNENIISSFSSTVPFSSSSIFTPIEGSSYFDSDRNDKISFDSVIPDSLVHTNVLNEPAIDKNNLYNPEVIDTFISQNIHGYDQLVETEKYPNDLNQQEISTVNNFTCVLNDSITKLESEDGLYDNKSNFCDRPWDAFPTPVASLTADIKEVHENLEKSLQSNDPEDDTEKADDEIKEIFSKIISNETLIENMKMSDISNLDSEFGIKDQLGYNANETVSAELPISLFSQKDSHTNLVDSFDYSNLSNSPILEANNCENSPDSLISDVNNENIITPNPCETFDLNSQILGNVSSSIPLFPNEPNDGAFVNESIDSQFYKNDKLIDSSSFFDSGIQLSNNVSNISNERKSPITHISESTMSLEKTIATVNSSSNVSNSNTNAESIPLFNYFSLMQPSSNDLNL